MATRSRAWPRPGATVAGGGIPLRSNPWAPGNVVAVVGGGGSSITITWNYPVNDGNLPIIDYIILPYIGPTAQPTIDTGSSALAYTVSTLAPGTTYAFSVQAVNAFGSSPWSGISNWVTEGVVAAPWDVSALVGATGFGSGSQLP